MYPSGMRNKERMTCIVKFQRNMYLVTSPKGSALVTAPIIWIIIPRAFTLPASIAGVKYFWFLDFLPSSAAPYFSRSQNARKRLPETEALLGELFLTAPDGILNAATSKRAVLIFSIERDRRFSQSAQRFCHVDTSPSASASPMRFHSRFAHFRPIRRRFQ